MVARIEAGEATGILAWHPDRLARNSVDGGKVIYLVDTGVIVEMKFPTFWCDTTPQGKFMLSVSNYQQILRNPIFTGLMRYGGEIYEGKHEPIITKKLFDSVQEVMSRKSKPKGKGLKPFLYRGFFRCGECGCFITTEQQKGHNYLRCTKRKNPCLQKYVREDLITSQIKEEIKKVSLPLDWTNWMIEENRKDQSSENQSSEIFSQKTKDEISLLDSGLFGGNSEQTALRADHIFASEPDFIFWRCVLDKVRFHFELNPDESY